MCIRTGPAALGLALLLGTATVAEAYERDIADAANKARISIEDMNELVTCLEAAHSVHPEWAAGSRADIIKVAFAIEASRALSEQSGGQEGAMRTCHLLRDLP
jgi:hypothetical protein